MSSKAGAIQEMLSKGPQRMRTVGGLERASGRIEQKTAEDGCMRVVKTFFSTASAASLHAASAALDAYEWEYVRWIAHVVARMNGQGLHRG